MEDKYIKFKNDSAEPFMAKWDGATKVLEPGDTLLCPEYQARKFAKDLAFTVLNRDRYNQELKYRENEKQIKALPITQNELQRQMKKYLITDIEDTFLTKAKPNEATNTKTNPGTQGAGSPEEKPAFK